jgi:pimeloyl-ACP methyl ester carboxylesterase
LVARTNEVIRADGSTYRRAGAGPVLLLVHGYLGGAAQWEQEFERLSDRFDVIAPDLPGFGDAAAAPCIDRIEGFAAHLACLMDELRIDRFHLLGHSMGGMIAQEFAARFSQRIDKLILYGTGPLGMMPDRFETLDMSRRRLAEDGVARTIRRIGSTWFRHGDSAKGFQIVAAVGAKASQRSAQAGLDAMSHWDGRAALSRLVMPSLVIWGDGDQSYRWSQVEALWKGLPNSQLAVIPGTAHAAHLEKSGLFQALLLDFLTGD